MIVRPPRAIPTRRTVRALLPLRLADRLDEVARRRNQSESVIVREAVALYLAAVDMQKPWPPPERLVVEAREGVA